ncbi:nuclear transport factor 2 family protein [Niabella insulamsoli]|uniref:YybH family protein n=1 Tax=Niabella insulamsoli TaxID=3144874 RepID=UPI0031FDEAAC
MKLGIVLALLLCVANVSGQTKAPAAVRGILEKQTRAWNEGNLEQFMNTYWQNDSLVFVGKSGVTYGWKNTLLNYKKNYPDRASMGQLNFDLIRIEALSESTYNIIGKWKLTRSIGNLQGHFTLIVKKIGNQWLIVQDHSS